MLKFDKELADTINEVKNISEEISLVLISIDTHNEAETGNLDRLYGARKPLLDKLEKLFNDKRNNGMDVELKNYFDKELSLMLANEKQSLEKLNFELKKLGNELKNKNQQKGLLIYSRGESWYEYRFIG